MRSRKGAIEFVTRNIGGLVLAALVIVGLVAFVSNIIDAVFNAPEDATFDNFDALVATIDKLVKKTTDEQEVAIVEGERIEISTTDGTTSAILPYYIQDEYGLVGFDSDKVGQTCDTFNRDMVKPDSCISLPCLCIAKLGAFAGSFRGSVNNYVRCETLKNVKYISASPQLDINYGKNHPSVGGTSLAMWSDCGLTGKKAGVRNIKISRIPTPNLQGTFNLFFEVVAG
jgi:hypothetical protein